MVASWLRAPRARPGGGAPVIVNPDGQIIAGPAYRTEEILYAQSDPRQVQGPTWRRDVAGHDARPDVCERGPLKTG